MSTTTTTNGSLKGTFTAKCLRIIERARHLDGRNIDVVWVASRGEACANVAEQYIKTPYPLAPQDLGTFLHEFSHFLSRDTKRDDPRSEYRAADYAVRTYESLELPDVEAVLCTARGSTFTATCGTLSRTAPQRGRRSVTKSHRTCSHTPRN